MIGMSYSDDGTGEDARAQANVLLDMCKAGEHNPYDVLENLLVNWLSSDEANEFARTEYGIEEIGEDGE
jgi:hypothetical protein